MLSFNLVDGHGIIQEYEDEVGFKPGEVSGNTIRMRKAVAQANLGLDDFTVLALTAGGTFQYDDVNHVDGDGDPDYPIVTADLVQGQQDYPIYEDGNGNMLLEFFKVMVANEDGTFVELTPRDMQSERCIPGGFLSGATAQGRPTQYDKSYNGIFFDVPPSYSRTGGIKALVNRTSSYFTTADTSKKPGIPGTFHRYIVLKMAIAYGRRKTLKHLADLRAELAGMETDIKAHYARRARDERKRITTRQHATR